MGELSIYYDEDKEVEVVTQSMIGTFRRCPQMASYKYIERLKLRGAESKPLTRGVWLHELLEVKYSGGDWRIRHKLLTQRFNELSDDDKETLGDLPREIRQLMKCYEWHYGEDPEWEWKVHETEFTLDVPLPNGSVFRCRIDALIENPLGLWIVDHKSHKELPNFTFRLRDVQSALYLKAALLNKIPVQGFIWNYLRTKPPTVPQLVDVKRKPRLSSRAIDTDYPTYLGAIRSYQLDVDPYREKLRYLRSQRWHPDRIQSSAFFQRHTLEKGSHVIDRVWREMLHTHQRMLEYSWDKPDDIERVTDKSCAWRCSYTGLCDSELFGGNSHLIRTRQYRTGDPLDYYDPKEMEN